MKGGRANTNILFRHSTVFTADLGAKLLEVVVATHRLSVKPHATLS